MQQGATAVDCEQSIITSQALAPDTRETSLPAGDRSLKNYFSLPTNKPNLLSVPSSSLCFQTWFSPNVVVSMCGNDAHISVCSSRKPGLLATIFYILEKHKLDVLSAHISSTQQRSIYMIHAHVSPTSFPCFNFLIWANDIQLNEGSFPKLGSLSAWLMMIKTCGELCNQWDFCGRQLNYWL